LWKNVVARIAIEMGTTSREIPLTIGMVNRTPKI
jgi:hypothetical protein